ELASVAKLGCRTALRNKTADAHQGSRPLSPLADEENRSALFSEAFIYEITTGNGIRQQLQGELTVLAVSIPLDQQQGPIVIGQLRSCPDRNRLLLVGLGELGYY